MKRLLTIAFAAMAATAINAATVAWGGDSEDASNTAGYTDVSNPSSKDDDYIGYAPAGAIYSLIYLGETYTGATSATKYDKDTGLTDLGGTVVKTHTLTAAEADEGAWSGDSLNSDIYDSAGNSNLNGFYMVSFYNPITDQADATLVGEISGLTAQSSADVTFKGIAVGSSAGSLQVVPEPTSAMLIAIGLAALGLKRKVA